MSDQPITTDPAQQDGASNTPGKQSVRGVATEIAASAARGAATGGVAGAVKSGAIAAVRNRRFRGWLIAIALAVVLIIAFNLIMNAAIASSIVGMLVGGKDENAAGAARDSGQDNTAISRAVELGDQSGLPWQLVLALEQRSDPPDLRTLAGALAVADPGGHARDLTAGASYNSSQSALTLPTKDQPERYALAESVETAYTTALTSSGMSDQDALAVFRQARSWALGEGKCTAATSVVADSSTEGTTVDGATYTAAQVANIQTIIGVAKTMFPGDWEGAAIIGLSTAKVESSFQNYANDGEVTGVDGSGADPSDYAAIAASLGLPHDAVGSDHLSLGIMQQQVWWGNVSGSSWPTDTHGVIARLMTPSFAAAKFFTKLDGVAGWQSQDPGTVAQQIQVSAFPDRYAAQVAHSKALIAQFGASSQPVAVPDSISWTALPGGADAAPAPCGMTVVSGEAGWPVPFRADGMFTGYLSSLFGWRNLGGEENLHKGIDFAGYALNTTVTAAAAGTVIQSRDTTSSINCQGYIRISHADGTSTGYLHLNEREVQVGDTIAAGQEIGKMGGQIGCSTGVHLHFYACDASGIATNPLDWLAARGLAVPESKIDAPFMLDKAVEPSRCL